jgi:tungstate transport system substrate-binding protein
MLVAGIVFGAGTASAEPRSITVASTTSTQNSGLFDYLLPKFTAASGIEVRVVAVGTGQAIRLATNGDADVLLVHHPASERKFVADGFGVARHPVMHNDFVLVGPGRDPAGVHASPKANMSSFPGAMTVVRTRRSSNSGRPPESIPVP